jgi:hypothetical protein
MPFGDRTGPQGLGPRTGRRAGYCSGVGMPGSIDPVLSGAGFGFGRGRGWFCGGRGLRNWCRATGLPRWAGAAYGYPYGPSFTAKEETDFLRVEADSLRRQLEDIENRISILEKAEAKEN